MLRIGAPVELVACWLAWSLAFVGAFRRAAGQKVVVRAPRSRWGIVFQAVGFALVFAYVRTVGYEKPAWALVISTILGPPSVWLGWAAVRHLGKQWRYQAALSEDHELIQTGPYGWIRHPIYASMLGLFLEAGFAWTWWPMMVTGLVFFLIGVEIRVRAEERLLAARFGEAFRAYRTHVPAYVPFVR